MIDELVVPFGLAALEGENALPFPDEVVAQRLQQDDGPQADEDVYKRQPSPPSSFKDFCPYPVLYPERSR